MQVSTMPDPVDVFIVNPGHCHVALLQIIAARLGVEPAAVEMSRDANGKPYVLGGPPFSLSHSGEIALIAIGESVPVGVDVEQIKANRPVERLIQRFFSPYERKALQSLSGEELVEAFYWCWAAKEAYLKALGIGLRRPLASFDVSVDLIAPPILIFDRQAVGSQPWTLRRLAVVDGYAAMLAVAAPNGELRQLTYVPTA
jgi:4'-phosphopantetheinyl transferase